MKSNTVLVRGVGSGSSMLEGPVSTNALLFSHFSFLVFFFFLKKMEFPKEIGKGEEGRAKGYSKQSEQRMYKENWYEKVWHRLTVVTADLGRAAPWAPVQWWAVSLPCWGGASRVLCTVVKTLNFILKHVHVQETCTRPLIRGVSGENGALASIQRESLKVIYWVVSASNLRQRACESLTVAFSHSVKSDSLRPHGLQHASFPVLHYLLEFSQTHVHWFWETQWMMPSHHLILCWTKRGLSICI